MDDLRTEMGGDCINVHGKFVSLTARGESRTASGSRATAWSRISRLAGWMLGVSVDQDPILDHLVRRGS